MLTPLSFSFGLIFRGDKYPIVPAALLIHQVEGHMMSAFHLPMRYLPLQLLLTAGHKADYCLDYPWLILWPPCHVKG